MTETQDTVIEYLPERQRTNSSAAAIYILLIPLFVLMIVSIFSKALAWPAGIAAGAFMLHRKRRAKSVPLKVLKVSDGQLIISDSRGAEVLRAPLAHVSDIRLDTKAVEKVQENLSSGVPDVRFIDSRVGPSIDNARIEVCVGEKVHLLNDQYTSHIDASEWSSKIRRWLRKNGWTPLDERESRAS